MSASPRQKSVWFIAFTAVFAALSAYVFWGTWSLDVVPIMPDSTTTFPSGHFQRSLIGFLNSGRFIPFDLVNFLGSPYLWLELKLVLALYLSALGMVFYCRGRGLSRAASYGAGLLLGFCGYWMTLYSAGHFGWFLWMAHGVFAFGLADRAVRKGKLRNWLLLGAVVAWASYNQQDLWLLFTVFTAAYFVWCCCRERKLPWKGALLSAATFAIICVPNFGGGTYTDVLKSRKEQIDQGQNITQKGASERDRRWEFVTNWSMPIEDTLEFFDARVHGDTSCPFVLSINGPSGVKPYTGALGRPMNAREGNYRQHSLYVGFVTCLLALVGLFAVRRSSEARFFLAAAVVFYLLSLGRYCAPAYRIIFSLPMGDLIRCPVKWHHLTEFCLVVLAAYGLERVATLKFAKSAFVAAAIAVLGAANLAANDHLYCAPVNVRSARLSGVTMTMSVMERNQFQDPNVASAVRAGKIVSVARYLGHPNYYLVGVLNRPETIPPLKPSAWSIACAVLSLGMLTLLAVVSLGKFGARRLA